MQCTDPRETRLIEIKYELRRLSTQLRHADDHMVEALLTSRDELKAERNQLLESYRITNTETV